MPPLLTDRFDAALAFASAHHRAQIRKGSGIPYVSHLLAVASLVLEMGGDEDEAIGGLLHDAVEDAPAGGGPATQAEIDRRFGAHVAAIVAANSDTDEHPKPPWRPRKDAYLAAMAAKDPAALRVSLSDKLHNARSILTDLRTHGDAVWDRFSASGEDTRWYYRALLEAFSARARDLGQGAAPALDELRRTVEAIDREVSR